MIDAGYNYDRLEEKMSWLGIDPAAVQHILITYQDTDHVGAVEADSPGLFEVYIGEEENRYLTGEKRRRVYYGFYKLPHVHIENSKVLLRDARQCISTGFRERPDKREYGAVVWVYIGMAVHAPKQQITYSVGVYRNYCKKQ